ncbi:hypothetical protein FRC03_003653 [Tulasnella sp. 419]|nr:hypothetical protein FRC03_003653 [Tulasnella sp. 419]
MTTHNVVLPSASGHVDSQSAVPPTWAVTPPISRVPMLTDDDDTDYERYSASHGCIPSPTSPTAHSAVLHGFENNSHALAVPKLTDRNSWTSEGSKHGISIQEGSGYSHGVPALK